VSATPPTTAYLVRHGRTALNAAGVLRGHLNIPLDAVGQVEATRLGELFTPVRLVSVLSSPLRRALQTAAPIAAASGAVTRVEEAFTDRDYAQWSGVAADEIAATFGTLDAAPGVEAPAAFTRRVRDRWEEVAAELAGEAYMVVAHDAVCRCILGGVLGGPGTPVTAISQRTGCWNRLELRAGRWHAMVVDALPGDGRRPGPTPPPPATEPRS